MHIFLRPFGRKFVLGEENSFFPACVSRNQTKAMAFVVFAKQRRDSVCIIVKELSNLSTNAPTLYDKLDRWVVRILKWVSYVSAVALVGIMLVAFFNVIGEKLRQAGLPVTGIPASTEIIQYLHIPVVFLAMAYVTLDRGHTKIDLLSSKFPKPVQLFFAIVGDLCGIFVACFIAWRGFLQMINFMEINRMSSVTGVGFPLWPFAFILSVGYVLLALSFVWDIVRRVLGKDVPGPAADPIKGGEQ